MIEDTDITKYKSYNPSFSKIEFEITVEDGATTNEYITLALAYNLSSNISGSYSEDENGISHYKSEDENRTIETKGTPFIGGGQLSTETAKGTKLVGLRDTDSDYNQGLYTVLDEEDMMLIFDNKEATLDNLKVTEQ